MHGHFGDLITAMITPFDKHGALDLNQAEKVADHLISNGSDGIVVAGSTGESPTLTDGEKEALFKAVVKAVGGRAKVIAGAGTYSTSHSVHLTQSAEKAGVDGILLVTPYYNRPPQEGLFQHFTTVARSTSLPVLLYDIPIRSARKIEHETILRLSQAHNIVGIKDACGDAQGVARLIAEAPSDFHVYSGNDADTLPWLSVGAVGVIAVASHVVGPQMAEMIASFKRGDVETARKIHLDLMPVFDAMGLTTNPIPVKAAMRELELQVGAPRLPLVDLTAPELDALRKVLKKAGISN